MTWQKLVASNRAKPHTTSRQEIDGLRAVVDRDLKDAAITGLSEDRRFATAYNAVLQLATMAVLCAGYRVSAKQGHHENTFMALELAVGTSVAKLVKYFNNCRKKRNTVDYNLANVVTQTELTELLEKAAEFRQLVEDWIAKNHPHLA
jgi:uncharacterized protein (UPF0332 family)